MNDDWPSLHPNLLLIPGYYLAIFAAIIFIGQSALWYLWPWAAVATGIVCVTTVIDILRVRARITAMECKLTSIRWAPFGPGWFGYGRKNTTLYQIEYDDKLGQTCVQHVRVGLFYGVEFTD